MTDPTTLDPPVEPTQEIRPYQRGRYWFILLFGSIHSMKTDEEELAETAFEAAQNMIGPLGEEPDPEILRDFIAGAMREAEELLYPDAPSDIEQVAEYIDADPTLDAHVAAMESRLNSLPGHGPTAP